MEFNIARHDICQLYDCFAATEVILEDVGK